MRLNQAPVMTTFFKEGLVIPDLSDLPFVQENDLMTVLNGA